MNSLISVQRSQPDGTTTLGEMFILGKHECFTLEPAAAIPAGTYDLTIRHSPRFGRLMPHVENVPGFEGILIHWGNYAKDTEGCTIVGTTQSADFIGHSVDEFNRLFQKVQDAITEGPQTITYLDPFGNNDSGTGIKTEGENQ